MTYGRYRLTLEFWPDEGDDFTDAQRGILDRAGGATVEAVADLVGDTSGIGYLAAGTFYEGEDS